jgi:AraC-like DNA-binding protein
MGGGHEKETGIGQSWGTELYDPVNHTFEGIAALDKKRAAASAVEIDSGKVVIAGNWYADDAIELFDGHHTFSFVKDVSAERSTPYIFRTAKDDAIVFGSCDTHGEYAAGHDMVEHLRGTPIHEPLLNKWRTTTNYLPRNNSAAFIGNEQADDYTYLTVLTNEADSVAIAKVHNGEFSLLPTDRHVPTVSEWGKISYYPHVIADRLNRRAYVLGVNNEWVRPDPTVPIRPIVLIIDYDATPARLALGYTDPFTDFDILHTTLTSDGNLLLAGGIFYINNFKPSAATWLLKVNDKAAVKASAPSAFWPWALGAILLVLSAVLVIWLRKNRQEEAPSPEMPDSAEVHHDINAELMERICQLMEAEQLYLNPDLRVTHLADRLGIHRNQVSECINTQRGCTFSQFVAAYRIDYAKQLLCSHPEMTMAAVGSVSGFSSEKSFYRTFRLLTSKSPKEWAENGK